MMRLIFLITAFIGLTFSTAFAQNTKQDFINLLGKKEYIEAKEMIPQVLKNNPEDQQLHLLAGDVYFELTEYQNALKIYKEADDIDGGEPEVERKIAKAMSYLGKHKKAIEMLEDLVDDESNVENMIALADAYLKADSTSKAELLITKAKKIDDENPNVLKKLGDLYYSQRVYELAKNNY